MCLSLLLLLVCCSDDRVLRLRRYNSTGQTIGTNGIGTGTGALTATAAAAPSSSGAGGVSGTGSGLPSVHLNMVLDDDTAEQLARFVVRLKPPETNPNSSNYIICLVPNTNHNNLPDLSQVRLARHAASRCDTAVVCGMVREPRAPPLGAGPLAAGPGKQVRKNDA